MDSALLKHIKGLKEHGANREACVYFLVQGDLVVYVGKTMQLGGRLAAHRRNGKAFDRVFYVPCDETEIAVLEAAFIRLCCPVLNGHFIPGLAPRQNDALRRVGLAVPRARHRVARWLNQKISSARGQHG